MVKKFLLWFMQTKIYAFIVIHIVPFIRFSNMGTSFRGHKYHEGYFHLRAGMMIATIDYNKLTGVLIPKVTGGLFSHSALCVSVRDPVVPDLKYPDINPEPGHEDGLEVIEMTHTHFTYSDFFDLCKEAERVVIFDCKDWDDIYRAKLIKEALSAKFKQAKYDAGFTLGVSFLYCSELIYLADKNVGGRLKCSLEDLMGLGKPYISPDGLLTAENCVVVWDSKGELTGKTGPEIDKLVFT